MTTIELFQKLLQFRSITPDDDGAFEFISGYLEEWDCLELDFEDVKNRLYTKKFTDDKQHLCFAGHIDVVPPGQGWSVDPFEARIKDNMIIARGAQDMKSGVAAFLYACKHATNFKGTLSILLTSDEEADAINGTVKVLEHLDARGILPDFAVVAEPTCENRFGDAIKIGRRGSINGYVQMVGKQGHAAYPQKAINPIHKIAQVLKDMAGVNLDEGDEFFAPSQFVITDIRAGMEVTNVTPGDLKMMFNVRNSTKTSREDVEMFVHKHFNDLQYSLKTTQGSFPFMTDKNSKIVKKIDKSIEKICSIRPKHSTAGGTSDARFFGQFGVQTVEFGVINDSIHAIDEHTSIQEVENLTKVFSDLIENFDE
jgi:succinyl-diaminopimelate desuccinylase